MTRTTAFGTDVAIVNARTGAELLRLTNDGESWAPAWSPGGDQIAYLHVSGQVVDLRMAQLEGWRPDVDGQGDHRPDDERRPGRCLAAGLVHPGRPAARPRRRPRPQPRPRLARGVVTQPYLARLGARISAHPRRPVRRRGPGPGRPARRLPGDLAGIERFCRLILEASLPYAAAVKPNLAFFEAYGSAGIAALERLRALVPAEVLVIADAKRGDIGTHGRAPGDRPVRRARGRRRHREPVPRRRGRRAAARAGGPVRLRAVPDLATRVPASSRTCIVAADRGRTGIRRAALGHGSPAGRRRGDPGGTVGLVVGATAPAELAAIRALAPGAGVPRARASAPRAATSSRSSRMVPRGVVRPAPRPVARCSSTCRAASPARPWSPSRRGLQETLGSAWRAAAAEWAGRLAVLP